MKEAIGNIPMYNFIIIFIAVTFGFLIATLMYYKAFKLNSRIAYALEEYEGYNELSKNEINRVLGTLGYRKGSTGRCPNKSIGFEVTNSNFGYPICIYDSSRDQSSGNNRNSTNNYFNYGIITYIYIDIPLINGTFKIPVYTESEKIYKFNENGDH